MQRKKYTEEFKQEALRLSEELGSIVLAAKQLGIKHSTISNWRRRGISQNPPLANIDLEVKKLRKEVSELKKVNYILNARGFKSVYSA